ncbi:MAG: 4Fe-4S binding protein [Clostridia bacterium]|nr:4Fe-4S binding protein [Clostridia bacterium]
MSRLITDSCVSCGTCEPECPVNAISAGEDKFVISADECINCGACEAVCPTGAIIETEED